MRGTGVRLLLLSVQSAGCRRLDGRIEKNIPARSATDHVHLFAHHDPLACSELMINFAVPELL
jgi:hypothetical protein